MQYKNPVLTGMYPDPSVCRVGEDYYLVTSTFEYLPGVPVFHSRDLVNWEQIGHVIDRPEQMDFARVKASGGIYAPTIRYHDGTFYMVTTAVASARGGNFFMTAKDPAGPWSMPVWLEQSGIDPSLFFDEDGACYLTSNLFGGGIVNPVIQQSVINPATGEILDGPRVICEGTGGCSTEAPHLFKRGEYYYLVLAEGGTALGHMVTLFRARSPWGPFAPCPHNPILTARDRNPAPLSATGHADFVQTQHGETFIVFLCYRQAVSKYHHLGRETALLPVDWDGDGWPHVRTGKLAPIHVDTPSQLALQPVKPEMTEDDFTAPQLAMCYNGVRRFPEGYALEPGALLLHGAADTLSDFSPVFIGRRQRHFVTEIAVRLSFDPQGENEEAGVALRMCEQAHYEWVITLRGGQRAIVLKRTVGDMQTESAPIPCPEGEVTLVIRSDREYYRFGVQRPDGSVSFHASAMTKLLSSEVHWGFVGVYAGMYATGNGAPASVPARFTRFAVMPAGEE